MFEAFSGGAGSLEQVTQYSSAYTGCVWPPFCCCSGLTISSPLSPVFVGHAVKTTDHRARIVEQTKSTYLGALALEAQLARLPQHIPFGAIRNDLVRKYPEEHARNLAAFLGATTSKVSTILLKQLTAHNATALASERSFRTLLEPTDVKAMAMIL